MIDTGKYKGHTRGPWYPHNQDHHGEIMIKVSDDNWKSIGQMRTTADKLLAADAPLLLAEVKRLRKLEAAVVGSWMETINRGSSWHKQLRYPCVDLGYLELRDVEHISRIGNRFTSKEFHLKEEYEEMAKQWIKEQYGVEEE